MAAKKKDKKRKIIRRPVKTDCIFCKTNTEPDYKEHRILEQFLSDRAKILGRDRSGICVKHQRHLPKQIKRARHLGLISYALAV